MNLKKIDNIILFGGTAAMYGIATYLKKTKYDFYIFTSPRQLTQIINEIGTFEYNLKLENINYFSENDINKSKTLFKLIKKNSLGIGIAEPWKFSKRILEMFNNNLIDYMGIPLPKYRGGAHFTWMILQEEIFNGACFQIINKKSEQGVFDSGDKIEEVNYKNTYNRLPIDYFSKEILIATKMVKNLIYKIENKIKIKKNKINENKSFFLPRLNTDINGWINWQIWNAKEIVNFINAFSFPYTGASTLINNYRIVLQDAFIYQKKNFHPFQSGLICKLKYRYIYVITRTGIIQIKKYKILSKRKFSIKLGDRFFTPNKIIEKSLLFNPVYISKGLKK